LAKQRKMYAQNKNKQSEKCLWVKGGHGLGNRLLSLETACRYAYKHNLSVYIDWNDPIYEQSHSEVLTFLDLQSINSTLQPKIELYNNIYPRDQRLFTEPDLTKLITEKRVLTDLHPSFAPWRKYGRFKRRFRYLHSVKYAVRNGEFLDKLAEKNDLLCFCCSIPENEPEHFRHVKINYKKLDTLYRASNLTCQKNDIGLHIRNTDKNSGRLDKVIDCVNQLLNDNSSLKTMHLATDSLSIVKLISAKFKERLVIQTLNFKRNEEPLHLKIKSKQDKNKELTNALLDIYMLSQSRHLLFQENSSFSRVAVALQDSFSTCIDWTH